jgi:gliding motility-associated-like protein
MPGVFIPNAFRPGSVNGVFNPAEHFIGSDGYSLQIYNRFGEVIFETNDPSTGWDGTTKGHNCEMGVYVYRFRALDENGNEILRTSRVTLIR